MTARAHTRIRRTDEGDRWLQLRPVRTKRWTNLHRSNPTHDHDRQCDLEHIFRRMGSLSPWDERLLVLRITDRFARNLGALEAARPLVPKTPPPPTPRDPKPLGVKVVVLDGCAHVQRTGALFECVGCGRDDVFGGHARCPACQTRLYVVSTDDHAATVVTLGRSEVAQEAA